jgi:hypothetical protein
MYIYSIFHLSAAQYTFFSVAHRTFSKIDQILGHKESLNEYKKTEITPSILSNHNRIKLDYTTKETAEIFKYMRLSNTLLHNQSVINEIRKEIKKFLELMKMKTQPTRSFGIRLRGKFIAMSNMK